MATTISTNRDNAIRNFLLKLNSDDAFRMIFLNDPIGTLANEGITLNASAQSEVMTFVGAFKGQLAPNAAIPQGVKNVAGQFVADSDQALQQLAAKFMMA